MFLSATLFSLFLLALYNSVDYNPYRINPESIKISDYSISMILQHERFDPLTGLTDSGNDELKEIILSFESLDERVLRLKATDYNTLRWEVPVYNPDARKYFKQRSIKNMGFSYSKSPFQLELIDPRTQQLFTVANDTLYFADKLIEIGLWFPADAIFGLGERVTPSFDLCEGPYRDCIYTTFNKDVDTPLDEGHYPGGKQIYGHQPFYMLMLKNKQFMGVLFLNSNAQDTIVKRRSTGINVNHKTIGGIIDLYFFYPDTAENVIKNYHSFIGRPYLPPMWTLGYHQSRWGWDTLDDVKAAVDSLERADFPFDVIWSDIDHKQDYKDFTINKNTYGGLDKFVDRLHEMAVHWIPIVNQGLLYDMDDPYYRKGEEMNAFVRSAYTKKTLLGRTWPGHAAFLAWMNPNASTIWHMELENLYSQVKYDGIWIDMNEASEFCHSECKIEPRIFSETVHGTDPHDPKEFDDLPYSPGNSFLQFKSIAFSGYHVVDDPYGDKFYKEYNLHSLWAFHQANATYQFFAKIQKKRPFVMTRANFAGTGRFASKWQGDNHSYWEDMRYSIPGMFNFQLFGVPLIGADICGFGFEVEEELCARWMQLGAFTPFSRNHNAYSKTIHKEPYNWPRVAEAGRNAVRQKYSILRYYYTKLFEVSLHGGTLVKPLFFDYPENTKIYEYRNKVFMIGSAVMVVPVLEPGVEEVTTHLPNQNWFNLFTTEQIYHFDPKAKEGKKITMKAGFDYVNILIKGGNVIPFQDALRNRAKRVAVLDSLPLEVIVAPDEKGEAKGTMIFDNEKAINPIANKEFTEIKLQFSMENKKINVSTAGTYRINKKTETFNSLTILGAEAMSHVKYACIRSKSGKLASISGVYFPATRKLTFYQNSDIYWGNIVYITFANNCY
eukprot:TRINITY_DN1688_c0_g1_i6.p1 TRINITY_DN1688_c0_g1~~TRINITY_DN1688_c0_g1_i6.p1  ORF type:complete len:893 (+),score=129.11 TRINITY_DN1688_c0_g1_i6:234-2912(+)